MTTQRALLEKGIILTVLIMSFTLVASLMMENTRAAITTSKFAYETKGNEISSLPAPKTITLCNYTTPPDTGIITQISICLTGIQEGSHVRAVIFPNDPDSNLPQGGESLAQSIDTLNVTSVLGEWYNFTMNYPASQNTVYWLGYYADNFTQYYFDTNNNHMSLTSQTKDENSQWLPVAWHYQGKTIMSLYAQYTVADPQPTPTLTPTPTTPTPTPMPTTSPTNSPTATPIASPTSHPSTSPTAHPTATPTPTPTSANPDSAISDIPEPAQSFQDIFFVLLIIGAESTIVVTDQNRKKKSSTSK